MHRTHLIAALLATLLLARESAAQWQPGGLPIAPGPGAQVHSGVVSDGAAGAFVAWYDITSGHSRVLRIDGAGHVSPGWPAAGIDVAGVQAELLANPVSDGSGGVILFASAPSGVFAGARAFRFDANGDVPSPWPAAGREVLATRAYPGPTFYGARAIPDALGGAFLLWTADKTNCPDHDCSSSTSVSATRVLADGTLSPFGPRMLASYGVSGSSYGYLLSGDAIADGSGGLLALVSYDYLGYSYVIHYDATGVAQAQRYFSYQIAPRGCLLPGGDYLVATGDYPPAGSPEVDVHLYRMTPSLSDAPGWPAAGVTLGVSGGEDRLVQVVPDGGSGAFVVFESYPPGVLAVLRAQHVTGASPPVTTLWPAPGVQIPFWGVAFATDGVGGLVSSGRDYGTETMRALQLDASGKVAPGTSPSGVALTSPPTTSFSPPAATRAGTGGVIVVWSEHRAGDWNVYAQRLPLASVVSTVVAGVVAENVADGVRVTWWLQDGLSSELLVERSVESGAWRSLGPVSDVSFDRAVHEDHEVSDGSRYAYRLRAAGAPSPLAGSDVSVNYSLLRATALVGFVPSPAVGSPRVRFQLADRGMSELQIIDVSGRLVARRDVSGLAPGAHELEAGRLAPGLYTLRLCGPSGTRVARGVVLR